MDFWPHNSVKLTHEAQEGTKFLHKSSSELFIGQIGFKVKQHIDNIEDNSFPPNQRY